MEDISRSDTEAFLRELGADDEVILVVNERVKDRDIQTVIRKFRTFAEQNPAVILAALSAVILGGGAVAARKVMKSSRKSTKRKASASGTRKRSRSTSKRTLIEPHPGDKRYVRRNAGGQFKESVDVGRSLSADRKRTSKTRAKAGQGDRGDR